MRRRWYFVAIAVMSAAAVAVMWWSRREDRRQTEAREPGQLRWKTKAGGWGRRHLVTCGRQIYCVVPSIWSMDRLCLNAYDAATGKKLWTKSTQWYDVCAVEGIGVFNQRKRDRRIQVLDPRSGKEIAERACAIFPQAVLRLGRDRICVCGNSGLESLDAITLEAKWQIGKDRLQGMIDNAPDARGDFLCFVTDETTLHCVDANGGSELWSIKTPEKVCQLLVADKAVCFVCKDGNLYGLDPRTGTQKWVLQEPSYAHLLCADGDIFIEHNGAIERISPDTGQKSMVFDTGVQKGVSDILLTPESVYYGLGSVVYSVDPATHIEKWRYDADTKIVADLVTVGDTIFFTTAAGYIYALRR